MRKEVILVVVLAAVAGLIYISGVLETPTDEPGPQETDQPVEPEVHEPEPEPNEYVEGTLKGVSLSPRSFTGDDFVAFFAKAAEAGEVITWAGDWMDLVNDTAAKTHMALSGVFGYEPVILLNYLDPSTGESLRGLTPELREAYLASLTAFAEEHQPGYVAVGVEVNSVYLKSPDDYPPFVGFFQEAYDAVKAVSPDTVVFTVFQLERMKGLNGGLFGGENDPSASQWGLIDDFPSTDIVAFTSYPCLAFGDPSEIPGDYYTEILSHTSKPIAFVELGWFRDGFPGWESDVSEQAEFIDRFFLLTEETEPVMVIWSFLYDVDAAQPFDSMGLLDYDETSTEAWDAWTSH
jgi:hypothetical protein